MKFNQFKNIGMLVFFSLCAWVLHWGMVNYDGLSYYSQIKVPSGFLLVLAGFPFIFFIFFMRLFVWRVGLEKVGDDIAAVTTFQKHVVPLSEITHYELKNGSTGQHHKYSITLRTKYKDININPQALEGGVDECRKYLKSHGIKEVNLSGGRKWAMKE